MNNNVAINAAKIALLSEDDGSSTNQCDQIVMAATRLSILEKRRGFEWEDQNNGWESVCQLIADRLRITGRVPTQEEILGLIENEERTEV